jgi:hypothetical protein
MPATTLLDMPHAEQAQMLTALRRARYGYLLGLHIPYGVQSAVIQLTG